MRTKTLLIAAAALAAGVISSQAQPVYSQNIVGYVNQTIGAGFNNLNVPLDLAAGNTLTNLFPNPVNSGAGPFDGTTVYLWNGTGFTIYTIDSYWPTGVGDYNDEAQATSPTINPGTLYFFYNNLGASLTNTVVGTVHVDGAASGTQVVGTTTNTFGTGFTFVASKLPIAGGVTTVLGISNPVNAGTGVGPLDGTTLYFPNINATGGFLGYNIITIDSYWSTGFGDYNDEAQAPEPIVPVGAGFIFDNNTGAPIQWIQSL